MHHISFQLKQTLYMQSFQSIFGGKKKKTYLVNSITINILNKSYNPQNIHYCCSSVSIYPFQPNSSPYNNSKAFSEAQKTPLANPMTPNLTPNLPPCGVSQWLDVAGGGCRTWVMPRSVILLALVGLIAPPRRVKSLNTSFSSPI